MSEVWCDALVPEGAIFSITVLQMCALCESIGRGVHFNPYASIGRQVHGTSQMHKVARMCADMHFASYVGS